MKRLILGLIVCATSAQAMLTCEVASTMLLTGAYYSFIEMGAEQSKPNPNFQRRNARLFTGVGLHTAGLVALLPTVTMSYTPVFTVGKYMSGAFCMAQAIYMGKCAKIYHDEFIKSANPVFERECKRFAAGALLFGMMGSSMVTWALTDTKK